MNSAELHVSKQIHYLRNVGAKPGETKARKELKRLAIALSYVKR
jgi:hypothetical protein